MQNIFKLMLYDVNKNKTGVLPVLIIISVITSQIKPDAPLGNIQSHNNSISGDATENPHALSLLKLFFPIVGRSIHWF